MKQKFVYTILIPFCVAFFASFFTMLWAADWATSKSEKGVVVACAGNNGEWFPPRADGMCHLEDAGKRFMPETCLAKMEAAMKKTQPYLGPIVRFRVDGAGEVWLERKLEDRTIDTDKLLESEKLWNETKRECWRQP